MASFKTIPYLQTITSDIQVQVDGKQSLISSPVANDFTYVNSLGQTIDSGISLSTDAAFSSPSDFQVPSTQAVQTFVINTVGGNTPAFEAAAIPSVNINLSNPGTSTFDDVSVNVGDYIFILPSASGGAQTTATQGGIYVFNGAAVAMTRLPTMSTWGEIAGARIFITTGGTTYGNTVWQNTNVDGGTIGTTPVTYVQIQQNYNFTNGLVRNGNNVSIDSTYNNTFNTETLSANTNYLVAGTTNTMTYTMATLTASHVFTLPNANSNSIQPLGSATSNQWVQYVDSSGVQHLSTVASTQLSDFAVTPATDAQFPISNGTTYTPKSMNNEATMTNTGAVTLSNAAIIAKVLTGFATQIGTISATDSLLVALEKLAAITTNATLRTQATSATLLLTDQGGEVDVGANSLTLTLPAVASMKLGKQFGITINTVGFTGTSIASGSGNINGNASPFPMNATYWVQTFYTIDNTNWLVA